MPAALGFAFFATEVGECAVAWNAVGLAGVWLPDAIAARLRSRVARRCPQARESEPPAKVAAAIAAMQRLLGGERVDWIDVDLDESALSEFDRRVYVAARAIAPGRAVTYGELAGRLGAGTSARAVGQSLGRNPFPIVVPCHRIIAADGMLGGFSAPGGAATKRRMLTIEDARLDSRPDLFDPTPSVAAAGWPSA